MAQGKLTTAAGWLLLLCVFCFLSCRDSGMNGVKIDAQEIARMECVSREFTHRKFLLANEYGKVDQLVVDHKISPDSALQLRAQLDREKTRLVSQAQVKSDSLLHFLRVVWKEKYVTREQRRVLDSLTEVELRHGCPAATP